MLLGAGKVLLTPNHVYAGPNKLDLSSSIPSGLIAMWSGSVNAVPSGWSLCNGQNGTPNLQDRFIVGAGSSYNAGATGGSNTVTLSVNQIPSHGHSASGVTCSSSGEHSHIVMDQTGPGSSGTIRDIGGGSRRGENAWNETYYATNSAGAHTHSISGSISNTGGDQSHENRPPYYALAFIMKL